MAKRISTSAVYAVEDVPGISGFKRWNERETRIMRGDIVRARMRRRDAAVYRAQDGDRFRLEDGHLPEYQPEVSASDAVAWVRETGGTAVRID